MISVDISAHRDFVVRLWSITIRSGLVDEGFAYGFAPLEVCTRLDPGGLETERPDDGPR